MKGHNSFTCLKFRICFGFFIILFLLCNVEAMLPHMQNFDATKIALRTALGERPNSGPLSVITVTRSPVDPVGTTELISHNELEQLLRLLYSLCSGTNAPNYSEITGVHYITFLSRIPGVNRFRNWWWNNSKVFLSNTAKAQLPVGHQHIMDVDSLCGEFKYFHDQYLLDACNIVVFNEMFFSQVDPLTLKQKDFIADKLIELSLWSKNTVFYPNFLYTEDRNISGQEIHNFLNTMDVNVASGKMNIQNQTWCVQDCRNEIVNRRQVAANGVMHKQKFLVNETYGINRGEIVTKYKKATYWNESNDTVSQGVLYDFGVGTDTRTVDQSTISDALTDNISTEICYDLAQGVRQNNNWSNGVQSSKMHILQSNSVDPFCGTWPNDNINRLPLDVPIIYADSYIDYHRAGLPFCHDLGGNIRVRSGEFPYRLYDIRIGDSVYTVGIYLR